MAMSNPLLQYRGSQVAARQADLLVKLAQGRTSFNAPADITSLTALQSKGYLTLRYFPSGSVKVELLGKGEAWLHEHVPAALQRHTEQGPVGRAIGPLHQQFLHEQLEAHKQLRAIPKAQRHGMKTSPLQIQSAIDKQARQELATWMALEGKALVWEAVDRGTPWQRLSAAALKRAKLAGLPPAVARQTLMAIGREYQAIKGYDPLRHNPLSLRFLRYIGEPTRWWDWAVARWRHIRPGAMVIADTSDLQKDSVPVATRGKGFLVDLRRRDLQDIPSFTPPAGDRGVAGQLFTTGREAGALRQYKQLEGGRAAFFQRKNPAEQTRLIAIAAIVTNKAHQPRAGLDEANLQRLVTHWDPKRLTPLEVRRKPGGRYELIHGHHRLEAARRLGLATVPVRVLKVTKAEAQRLAEEANLSGKSLTPMEMARVVSRRLRLGDQPADIVAAMPGLGLKQGQVEDFGRIVILPKTVLETLDDPAMGRRFTRDHAIKLAQAQAAYKMPPSEVQAFVNRVVIPQELSPQQMERILATFALKHEKQRAEQGTLFGKGFGGNYSGLMQRIADAARKIKELESIEARLKSIQVFIQSGRNVPKKLEDARSAIGRELRAVQQEIQAENRLLAGQQLSRWSHNPTEAALQGHWRKLEAWEALLPANARNPVERLINGYYALLPRRYALRGGPSWWIGPFRTEERADIVAGLASHNFARIQVQKLNEGWFVGIYGGLRLEGGPRVGPFDTTREAGSVLGKLQPNRWQPVMARVTDLVERGQDTRKLLPPTPAHAKEHAALRGEADQEALAALKSLGYLKREATEAVSAARSRLGPGADSEALLRTVFKDVGKKNPRFVDTGREVPADWKDYQQYVRWAKKHYFKPKRYAAWKTEGENAQNPRVRLNDLVRTPQGKITTLNNLLDSDNAKLTKIDNWRGREHPAYFVDLLDGGGSWEIGQMAYESAFQRQRLNPSNSQCPACGHRVRVPRHVTKLACHHCGSALGVTA